MTEAEKREIIQAVLANGSASTSVMGKAFGGDGPRAYSIWELTRRATCAICGVHYVNQLKDLDDANAVADSICQVIYDLAAERRRDE